MTSPCRYGTAAERRSWRGGRTAARLRSASKTPGSPTAPVNPQALDDVSFTVEPGRTVALVGRSGAGKSTCANLLMRFWDPGHGRILLGGHDLRDFGLDHLRRQIALVTQDTLFVQRHYQGEPAFGPARRQ